jgi:hypothetical protein
MRPLAIHRPSLSCRRFRSVIRRILVLVQRHQSDDIAEVIVTGWRTDNFSVAMHESM